MQLKSAEQQYLYGGIDPLTARQKAIDEARTVFKGNIALAAVDALQYAGIFKAFGNLKDIPKVGKILDTGYQMGSEAAEEGYQSILGKEAHYAETGGEFLGPGFSDRFSDYLKDSDVRTSMFWGAVGGGAFHAMGPLANKIVETKENLAYYESMCV